MATQRWIIGITLLCCLNAAAQNPFQRTFGGEQKENCYGVIATSEQGVFSVGSTESFGAGKSDIYLVKTDKTGNLEWAKTYGGSKDDFGTAIEKTKDNNYVLLGYSSSFTQEYNDLCLIKINEAGEVLWSKTYGLDKSDYSMTVKCTKDGGFVLLGETINFIGNDKNSDLLVIKTDKEGNTEWSNVYGGNNTDYGYNIEELNGGGYLVSGETNSYGKGEWDFYMIRLKANGNVEWSKTFGESKADYGRYAIQCPDGGFIIGGNTLNFSSSNFDFMVIKTNSLGEIKWSKILGGAGTDYMLSMKSMGAKGFLFTGYSNSAQSDVEDMCIVCMDYDGKVLWNRLYGSVQHDYGVAVNYMPETNEILIGGSTTGFGTRGDDIFLIKTPVKNNQFNDCNLNFLYPFNSKKIEPKESQGHYQYELHCAAMEAVFQVQNTITTEQVVCTPEN